MMRPAILRSAPICSGDGAELELSGYTFTCPICDYQWDIGDPSGTYGIPPEEEA